MPGVVKPQRSPSPRKGASFTAPAEMTPGRERAFSMTLLVEVAVVRSLALRADGEVRGQQVVGPEAGIHAEQLHEAPGHEPGAHHENHRQRDLGHHQDVPET